MAAPLPYFVSPHSLWQPPLAIFCIPTHFVGDTLSGATPDISRIPKCLTTRFTTESPDTFQDIHMSETDSYRESPDISGIPKHHLTGSVLNLITPPRTSKCQKQIPVENHRTSLGFPSLIKQVHY